MPFSRQQLKNGLLYALIGFFVVGGVGVSKASAAYTVSSGGNVVCGFSPGVIVDFYYYSPTFTSSVSASSLSPTDTGWTGYDFTQSTDSSGCFNNSGGSVSGYNINLEVNQVPAHFAPLASTTNYFGYQLISGSVVSQTSGVVFNPLTHFTSETISTSTRTITVNGYINPDDIGKPVMYSLNVSTPIYATWDQDSFTATTSGNFSRSFDYTGSFASTTIEQFTFAGQLYYFTGNPFSDAESTQVLDTFSTTTFPGTASDFTAADIEQGIADNCKPFSSFWSVGLCIQYLVYPSTSQVTQNLNDIKQTFLTKMPMGYITRLVQIIAASTTTQLPVLSYTWQSDSPLSGDTLSFDTGTYFAQAAALNSEMTSNTDHKTAWQIFEPLINIFLAIVLIFGMIHDISGLPLIHHKK